MSVQNIQLKVQDIMQEYEEIAVQFYEDEEVLRAVAENVTGWKVPMCSDRIAI